MSLSFRPLTGAALDAALDDLARLRITVFADWPYLYDGDLAYERRYLARFRESAGAILVGAFDGARLVGASTGAPMADHADAFAAAFEGSGEDIARLFYCAESVLLPEYRGQGAGRAFFALREAHARDLGLTRAAFCAVIRPEDHPMKPAAYRPLAPFWRALGYRALDGAIARFAWKDIGEAEESEKPLQVWIKPL